MPRLKTQAEQEEQIRSEREIRIEELRKERIRKIVRMGDREFRTADYYAEKSGNSTGTIWKRAMDNKVDVIKIDKTQFYADHESFYEPLKPKGGRLNGYKNVEGALIVDELKSYMKAVANSLIALEMKFEEKARHTDEKLQYLAKTILEMNSLLGKVHQQNKNLYDFCLQIRDGNGLTLHKVEEAIQKVGANSNMLISIDNEIEEIQNFLTTVKDAVTTEVPDTQTTKDSALTLRALPSVSPSV